MDVIGRLKCITATYATAASITLGLASLFQPLLLLKSLQTDWQDIFNLIRLVVLNISKAL